MYTVYRTGRGGKLSTESLVTNIAMTKPTPIRLLIQLAK